MSKLNKVLAMSLAALTFAGSSSQVFAGGAKGSDPSKERKIADVVKPVKREADDESAEEIVENWYKRFKKKVGNNGQYSARILGTAPTQKEVDAAREIIRARGVDASLAANILLKQHEIRCSNDKELDIIKNAIIAIVSTKDEARNEVFDFISKHHVEINTNLYNGYYSKESKKIARELSDFYSNEMSESKYTVEYFIQGFLEEAKEMFKTENDREAVEKYIEKLIESKEAMSEVMKVYVKRMVDTGADIPFLKEINAYANAL